MFVRTVLPPQVASSVAVLYQVSSVMTMSVYVVLSVLFIDVTSGAFAQYVVACATSDNHMYGS